MLNENCQATAVQAVNDLVAIKVGSLLTLLQAGVENTVRDKTIAGFGNILLADHFRVPLTTPGAAAEIPAGNRRAGDDGAITQRRAGADAAHSGRVAGPREHGGAQGELTRFLSRIYRQSNEERNFPGGLFCLHADVAAAELVPTRQYRAAHRRAREFRGAWAANGGHIGIGHPHAES